jgi:hypothetical protein
MSGGLLHSSPSTIRNFWGRRTIRKHMPTHHYRYQSERTQVHCQSADLPFSRMAIFRSQCIVQANIARRPAPSNVTGIDPFPSPSIQFHMFHGLTLNRGSVQLRKVPFSTKFIEPSDTFGSGSSEELESRHPGSFPRDRWRSHEGRNRGLLVLWTC